MVESVQELTQGIREEFPDFALVPKQDSSFMKLCDLGLRIITFGSMCDFMKTFTTTVGYTVYVPSRWDSWDWRARVTILRHERIHMRQRSRPNILWYSIKYLLLWLPCFFAYFRMKYEMEAYEESMKADLEYYGGHLLRQSDYRQTMISHFTGAQYFWTWPWRTRIEDWYDRTVERLLQS